MNVGELYAKLEERIPRSLSCEWDNDGLMCCPDPAAPVRRVLVALDITAGVADRAIAGGYDLIVSHHPLVFRPLRAAEPGDPVAAKVIRLLRAGVSAMSFHTRLDAVCGGVNDTLAAALGLTEVTLFGPQGEAIGRLGVLPAAMTLSEFAAWVRQVTGAPGVLAGDAGLPVRRVAVLGGSGSDELPAARAAGADTYLTGELAYHHLSEAPERGMNLLAAGHFYTENPVCQTLRQMLAGLDGSLCIDLADSNTVRVL